MKDGRLETVAESINLLVSHVESHGFRSWPSQTNDLHNLKCLLPSLALTINRICQGWIK